LSAVPVWLFSSGPLGSDGPDVSGEPRSLPQLMAATYAREHRTFHGRLDPDDLGLGERIAVKFVHAPTGDFRDWEAVRAWAREIGAGLVSAASAGAAALGADHP
jgi:menaquinone-dependent protoporphyrinogen oxidase